MRAFELVARSVDQTPLPARLNVFDIAAFARAEIKLSLGDGDAFHAHLSRSRQVVDRALAEGRTIYGVTTGFGASVTNRVDPDVATQLARNLYRYHGCGTGALLSPQAGRAIALVRAMSLCQGVSGVRPLLVERLVTLLNSGVAPAIPEEGSVGASGDLTPLSYLVSMLAGEREVYFEGELLPAGDAHARLGLVPLSIEPKESLAIMNGTSVMGALAALSWHRALKYARWAASLTAHAVDVTLGQPNHFSDRIFALKPHRGQRLVARWIRQDLAGVEPRSKVQDRYSIRCAPHVIGVLVDALFWMKDWIETEINGVNDNPILDPDHGVFHTGNFYGGHLCMVTDALKTAVASVADLLERQVVLLNGPDTNGGLPANLNGAVGPEAVTHHGFKAMEITASALCAEALKMTMPASSFSRSTEAHNQDKVSMGTLSARESLKVLDLAEKVGVIHQLAVTQAADLRMAAGGSLAAKTRHQLDVTRQFVSKHDRDRRMDHDIQRLLHHYQQSLLDRESDQQLGLELKMAEQNDERFWSST